MAGVDHSAAEGEILVTVAWAPRYALLAAGQVLVEKEQSIPTTFACAPAHAVLVVVDVEQMGQPGEALSAGALRLWRWPIRSLAWSQKRS